MKQILLSLLFIPFFSFSNNIEISKLSNRIFIELSKVSGKELITILWKKIPKDIDNHFKVEMRNVKLRKLLN
jgi:hypothetical protein